jgi:3-hydroxybutyryl-CoA dehydratase
MILALRILHFEDLSVGMTETVEDHCFLGCGGICTAHRRSQSHPSVGAFRRQDPVRQADRPWPLHREPDLGGAGHRLPGPGAVYISQTLNFRAPVRIGDQVDVTVTVAELIPERQRARLTCTCTVADEVVLDGEALVKVPSAAKSKRPLPRI